MLKNMKIKKIGTLLTLPLIMAGCSWLGQEDMEKLNETSVDVSVVNDTIKVDVNTDITDINLTPIIDDVKENLETDLSDIDIVVISDETPVIIKDLNLKSSGKKKKSGGGGSNAYTPWNQVYSYDDNPIIEETRSSITIKRVNVEKYNFRNYFFGKVEILEVNGNYSKDDLTWLGARLTIANPENLLEKFEVRLYPEENPFRDSSLVTVNYVDRSLNISERLEAKQCMIKLDNTYLVTITEGLFDNSFKAVIMNGNSETCELQWTNDKIDVTRFSLGVQSAGKYVISKFDEIISY